MTGKTVGGPAIVRRALPSVADFQSLHVLHQMAATQLAAAYCDALVQDEALRRGIIPPASISMPRWPTRTIAWRQQVAAPLVDRALNSGLLDDIERGA